MNQKPKASGMTRRIAGDSLRGPTNPERRPGASGRRVPRILYQDRDILVIDKPAGLLAVPIPGSGAPNAQQILASVLGKDRGSVLPVHRIDRYTSGLMVFARTRVARANLVRQFLAHSPLRLYLAVVRGLPPMEEGELRHFLKKVSWGFRQVVVRGQAQGGTLAITRYRVLEVFEAAALVEAQLITGLKNQIRVQFAQAGMPIWGDRHYVQGEKGAEGIDHQALHAFRLGFLHPRTGTRVEFQAEPPGEFSRLLARLRVSTRR
jgi:23S rRNA pseudouridine1911/1915/1917 synthase